jgi:kynurenine formamidase
MCVPGCHEALHKQFSRRGFAGVAGAVAAGAAMAPVWVGPAKAAGQRSFSRVLDLTYPLGKDFPTYEGKPGIAVDQVLTFAKDGLNLNHWRLNEHTGTHLDAPFHFSADGRTAEAIPVEDLVVPLVVIDVRPRAAEDADTRLTADDLAAFEAQYGRIPEGACVAMNSGWQRHVASEEFRNVGGDGKMHFPGFHVEAVEMLMAERNAVGIAVDTLSLDYGASEDFAVHSTWLPTNRWGLECVANLDSVPATGATLVVGAPVVKGATGGPSRVLALI